MAAATLAVPSGTGRRRGKRDPQAYDDIPLILAAFCDAAGPSRRLVRKALRDDGCSRINDELVNARRDLARIKGELTRLRERDRRFAQALQRPFLRESLRGPAGITVCTAYLPAARDAAAGGDWSDVFRLPDGRIGFSIGAVAGDGWQAAVRMVQVRDFIRALAMDGHAPFFVLGSTSRFLRRISSEEAEMATAIFGILDAQSEAVTYTNAGHPQPILATRDGRVEMLSPAGHPLGVRTQMLPPMRTVRLSKGALLVFYTDGLTRLARGVVAGETNLLRAVRCEASGPSRDPAGTILGRVLGGRHHRDDIALLAIMVAP